jgi:hypothetical protein
LENGQVGILAADYFDLFLCTAAGAEALREAVMIGDIRIGDEVPDGRYVAASGCEVYVLGGQVATEEEFVQAKLGKRALRLLRDPNRTEELQDMLYPWTW